MTTRYLRLQVADLEKPGPLPLRLGDVEMLAAKWGGPGSRRGRAWADIDVLARTFLTCDPSETQSAVLAWHHLLLAVGNFKRRGGLIMPPSLVGEVESERPDHFRIHTSGTATLALKSDDQPTWRKLTQVEGVGVPTATTLLSALWPGSHVIIDKRAMRAAIGLSATGSWDASGHDDYDLPERSPAEKYWRLRLSYIHRHRSMRTARSCRSGRRRRVRGAPARGGYSDCP
jgi:hypothetical protein